MIEAEERGALFYAISLVFGVAVCGFLALLAFNTAVVLLLAFFHPVKHYWC